MGISLNAFSVLTQLSNELDDSSVISLGNPFIDEKELIKSKIHINYVKEIKKERKIDQSRYLFANVLGVRDFKILDISSEEEPDYIADLNHLDYIREFPNQFDFVLDLGTQEHIFNNNNFLENVFKLLKQGGKYIFSLPANGYLEHGFRQYSPTFFFDLCNANSSSLRLDALSLHTSSFNLNALPLYQKLDPNFSNFCKIEDNNYSINLGPLTGTAISLINHSSDYVELLGMITKLKTNRLSLDASQCIYRNYKLNEILPSSTKSSLYQNIQYKSYIKQFFIRFPLPSRLKLFLLSNIIRLKKLFKKKPF
tara:strand:+ start:1337 stop:2266 length:930 start_codon:yes stop_codon:yes gene_type:complete